MLPYLAILGIASGILTLPDARAEAQHEFVLFPSVGALEVFDMSPPDVVDSNVRASADVLYSYSGERFRFLGEYLLSTDESELERLQFGWALSDNSMLWLGRFHSPASFWISEFHHGQYLQTSITRPSLEQWEDESGASPSHITGLNFELDHELDNEAALGFSLAAGLAPKFDDHELVPFDILDPRSGHGPSLSMRTSYRPDMFSSTQYGFVASWNEINVVPGENPALAELDRINQLAAGIFADAQWQNLRLIGSIVYHSNELRYLDGNVTDDYLLAYLQPEYSISDDLIIFGRVDIGDGEDDSEYLHFLPAFLAHRNMVGARWDFARFQSLTFEFADTSRQGENFSHEHFKELRVQWSAVFP
jgi:hypothetical protein